MYCKKYQETEDKIYNYLETLYEASAHRYINTTLKESNCFEIKSDLIKIYEYITYVEDFIQEVIVDLDKPKKSLNKLKKLKTISILNHKRRNMYTMVLYKNNIEINPLLTQEESKKILFRRLGKRINKVIE